MRAVFPEVRAPFAAVLMVCAAAAAAAQVPSEIDLSLLAEWFEGEFDSALQHRMEADAGLTEEERHPSTYVFHVPVDVPALGDPAFYVEEFQGGAPADVTRREIVTFEVDDGEAAIRMKRFQFNDPSVAQGALQDPARLGGLTESDVVRDAGCDVFWTRDIDIFMGAVKDRACVAGAGEETGQYAQYRLTLNPAQFMRVDRWLYADTDGLARGHMDELPAVHFRVR